MKISQKMSSTLQEKIKFLETELEQKNALIESLPCTISWIDKDLQYVGANKELATVLNYGDVPIGQYRVGEVRKDQVFYSFMEDFFKSEKSLEEVELNLGTEERPKYFFVRVQKVDDGNEAVLMGIDITERKLLEDQISRDERLRSMGEMAGSLTHEISNPVTSIAALLQIIENRKSNESLDSKYLTECLEKLKKSTNHLIEIIQSVQKTIRIEENDKKESLKLSTLISDAISLCAHKALGEQVDLSYEDYEEQVFVSGHEGELIRVFMNIISNAIDELTKYEKRWVKVWSEVQSSRVAIYIQDAGSGIPESKKDHIFKSFFTTKDKGKGTGLGLSLSLKIVDEHSGRLFVDSSFSNTTFVVELPLDVEFSRKAS